MSEQLPETPDAEVDTFLDDDGVLYDDDVTPEYGILGFTLRELLIVGIWAVAFIVSFFPLANGPSVWGTGIQWILPIGVPTVAVFLLVLRRFSPDGIRRVGSLGIDQFASVAFSVAAVVWIGALWTAIEAAVEFGVFAMSWSGIVQLLASVALVILTVFAPIVPGVKEDFQGRLVTLAHRNANPVRPVIARPRPEAPADTAADRSAAPEEATTASFDATPADSEPAERSAERGTTESPSADGSASATDSPFATASPSAQPIEQHQPSWDPADTATTTYDLPTRLDAELSGDQATDEIARFDNASQVPIAAHASGGDTGTHDATADDEYVPNYSRRSRSQEIASDTASIEALLGTAQTVEHTGAVEEESAPFTEQDIDDDATDAESNAPRGVESAAQPFWILAQTERDVHDDRGEPLFRIGPSAWALVIEDRGGAYVVRHDDGRIGYLHDIADITKG